MRVALVGGVLLILASCTLIVPIDSDVSIGHAASGPDGSDARDATREGGPESVPDVNKAGFVGVKRDGCAAAPDDPALVGWYPLDETEGTVAHDCSETHADLASIGKTAPVWKPARIAGGADFNGVDMCFGTTDPSLFAFEDGKPFTVSAWLYARQFFWTDNTGRWIIGHKISPNGWHFGADDPARIELDFEFGAGTKTQISATATKATWTVVTSTYTPGKAATWINGKRAEEAEGAAKVPSRFGAPPSAKFVLGCRNSTSGLFDGALDDVRIYARLLEDDEIVALAARK